MQLFKMCFMYICQEYFNNFLTFWSFVLLLLCSHQSHQNNPGRINFETIFCIKLLPTTTVNAGSLIASLFIGNSYMSCAWGTDFNLRHGKQLIILPVTTDFPLTIQNSFLITARVWPLDIFCGTGLQKSK